jgi:hypothetical protein
MSELQIRAEVHLLTHLSVGASVRLRERFGGDLALLVRTWHDEDLAAAEREA